MARLETSPSTQTWSKFSSSTPLTRQVELGHGQYSFVGEKLHDTPRNLRGQIKHPYPRAILNFYHTP